MAEMLCQASLPGLGSCGALWCRHVGSRHTSVPGSWAPLAPTCHNTARRKEAVPSVSSVLCHELSVEGKGKKGPHRGFLLP